MRKVLTRREWSPESDAEFTKQTAQGKPMKFATNIMERGPTSGHAAEGRHGLQVTGADVVSIVFEV